MGRRNTTCMTTGEILQRIATDIHSPISQLTMSERTKMCYLCGRAYTYVDHDGYAYWYKYGTTGVKCHKCYQRMRRAK